MIRSKLRNLVGVKILNIIWQVVGDKTGPIPMVRVLHVLRHVATAQGRVESQLEPTQEFRSVRHTLRAIWAMQ
jgi:hypothetical protein